MAQQSRMIDSNTLGNISEGKEVYLGDEYYETFNVTVLEVPKYGWKVKEVLSGVATIENQRRNLKLLMSLTVDTRFLKKEA
jgi:hypothetical protein